MKRTAKYLFLLAFTLVVSTAAQDRAGEVSDEPPLIIPEYLVPQYAMEQVVPRILVWSFKPRGKTKIIYLSEKGINPAWLPRIKNIDFRLVSDEEVERRSKGVYFFTKPELEEDNVYQIGFGFGDPTCKGGGDSWYFRISRQKVKLWVNGLFGTDCSGLSHGIRDLRLIIGPASPAGDKTPNRDTSALHGKTSSEAEAA